MNLYNFIQNTTLPRASSTPTIQMNTPTKFLLTCDNYSELFSQLSHQYETVYDYDNIAAKIKTIYLNHAEQVIQNETIQFQDIEIDSTKLDLNNSFAVLFKRVNFSNKVSTEHFTVEYDITYKSGYKNYPLNNIVIVKLYSDNLENSVVMKKMLENGISAMKFNKYDIGKAFCTNLDIETKSSAPTKKITRYDKGRWTKVS